MSSTIATRQRTPLGKTLKKIERKGRSRRVHSMNLDPNTGFPLARVIPLRERSWQGGILNACMALVALAAGAACSFGGDEDASVSVRWSLQYEDGVEATCQGAQAPTVLLYAESQTLDFASEVDWDCARGVGRVSDLPPGRYSFTLELLNADGGVVTLSEPFVRTVREGDIESLDPVVFVLRRYSFFADWQVSNVGETDPEAAVACETLGGVTVSFLAQEVSTGAVQIFDFPCSDFGMLTPELPGSHRFTVRLLDANGRSLSQTDLGTLRATAGGPQDLGFITFEVQSFLARWRIQRQGLPVSCGQVGASSVELQATLAGETTPFVFQFPCEQSGGATTGVPAGSYVMAARLLDAAGGELAGLDLPAFEASEVSRAVLPDIVFQLE